MIPIGSRLKQNRPTGVINVVKLALSGCRGICQDPLAASSWKKYWAPTNFGAASSKVGNTNLARFKALFSFLRSTQILSFPLLFCTGTMVAHHSFGPVTLSMMPASSIRLSSSFTLAWERRQLSLLRWYSEVQHSHSIKSLLAHT